MSKYLEIRRILDRPRIPLTGNIDLTYRCNDNCKHCWVRIPDTTDNKEDEFSLAEIRKIVDEAKSMGCREWSISGGEPMIRGDFAEIFDYISRTVRSYSINTNGTLITPEIAVLMKRKGSKMIAIYGATKDVHDSITHSPGSFEATMRGFSYLKEAGVNFTVQIIPLRDNYHQFEDMIVLAKSLSASYRIGAAWLYLSACGDPMRNKEIISQRLSPEEVIGLDSPNISYNDWISQRQKAHSQCQTGTKDGIFASCIANRRDFHIDPYGKMSFCCFIKDSNLRYDLRAGSFNECWDSFIPALADKVKITPEYRENCGSCELREDCRFCPVYGYLEHRSFSAKVDYLCSVAKENKRFRENQLTRHRRYYKIADITIQVNSDLPIKEDTFHPKFKYFETTEVSDEMVAINHHFSIPEFRVDDLGKLVCLASPWAVHKKDDSWIYLGIPPSREYKDFHRVAVFSHDYSRSVIYNVNEENFLKGKLQSLTLFPTDQLLLASILANRQGCYLHSCGLIFNGKGFLFAGHSEAGKSTIATMFKEKAEILCDDRIIVRRQSGRFRLYGTWSHGDVPEVSANSTFLEAIFFLEKSSENFILPMDNKKEIIRRLLSYLVKPLLTADWWDKMFWLIEKISNEVPCYVLYFDKSGKVLNLLEKI